MMLRPLSAGRPAVEHNFYQQATQVKQLAAQGVPQARRVTLDAMGVRVLSWGFSDFRAKSKGETAGGVQWKPITESAIVTRLLGRAPYQRNLAERRALTKQEKVLTAKLRRMLPKGKGGSAAAARKAIAAKFYAQDDQLITLRQKRNQLYLKREQMIAKEWNGAKICVDTGRLVNSLKAGGNADQIKQITDTSVLVGTQVAYGKYVDEKRPIFGPGFIDGKRQQELESLAQRVYEKEVKRLEGGK